MTNEFEVDLIIKHPAGNKTLMIIKKEPFMGPGFLKSILSTLKEEGVSESIYYTDDLSFTNFKTGEYTIGLTGQYVEDEELAESIHKAIHKYLNEKPRGKTNVLPMVDDKTFKSFEPNKPAKPKDKNWKMNLTKDSIEFLRDLAKNGPSDGVLEDDSELTIGQGVFKFPADAPEYMRCVDMCPQVSMGTCSDIFMDIYKEYLTSVVLAGAGASNVEDPKVYKKALSGILNMIIEFDKYSIDCDDCQLKDNCEYGDFEDIDED